MPPKEKYRVIFKNHAVEDEFVFAHSEKDAIILARAEKIKRGLDDRVAGVMETSRKPGIA